MRHLISKLCATLLPYLSLPYMSYHIRALNFVGGLRYACPQKNEIEKSSSAFITYFNNNHSEITLQMLKRSLTSITSNLSQEKSKPI